MARGVMPLQQCLLYRSNTNKIAADTKCVLRQFWLVFWLIGNRGVSRIFELYRKSYLVINNYIC